MVQLIEPGIWVLLKPGRRFLLFWFGSCQSGRIDGPPFVVWTFHFAVDPHARAHSRKKPIPHHYLWGALGSRLNLPSDLEEPLFHGVYYMFAIHLATMMIYNF